jgi:hypothetical protein
MKRIPFLKEGLAFFGVLTITRKFTGINGIVHVVGFFAGKVGFVEGDLHIDIIIN